MYIIQNVPTGDYFKGFSDGPDWTTEIDKAYKFETWFAASDCHAKYLQNVEVAKILNLDLLNPDQLRSEIEQAKKLQDETGLPVLGANGSVGKCDLCGAPDEELRPYGPNGENICYDCGMKDKAGTNKRMGKLLFGEDLP